MMRVWIFDSAMPLALGRPRQRLAERLRGWFDARSQTRHITIDLRGSESAARLCRAAGDMVLPLTARERADGTGEVRTLPAPDILWLSPSRRRRIGHMLLQERPDLVVLGDPLLAPLVPELAAARCPVRLIDDGDAAWHDLVARRMTSVEAVETHLQMAQLLRTSVAAFAALRPVPTHRGPGLEFTPDERYFDKMASVVMLATGHAEPDSLALLTLERALEDCRDSGLQIPDIVLIGFDADAARMVPGAVCHDSWMHLEGLVGSARALVLPMLSPALTPVAEAALALGTPVITSPGEAALAGLAGVTGLFATGVDQMALPLARLLDPGMTGEADWRAIAAAAGGSRNTRMMPAIPGLEAPPRPPQVRPRRILPALGQPEVLYNPLSRMLLVRIRYRRDSAVEDVRLLDAQGTEMIRLMPSLNARRLDPVQVEGGVVIASEALGGFLAVELHDAETCLQRIIVDAADFRHLQAEIAWMHQDGVMLHGAFWLSGAAGLAPGYTLSSGGAQVDLGDGQPVAMPETGGCALRFSVPLDLAAQTPVLLEQRLPGPYRRTAPLLQRPLVPTPALMARGASAPPELAALKDLHRGKRAWIIGNGPSVRLEDLAAIPENDIRFCFNRFYLSYASHPLRETYVVSADTLMIADFGQDMIEQSTGLPLFCLGREGLENLKGPHVVLNPFDGALPLFSMEPAAFVGVGGSSVFVALQMAHYMGLRDITLYGLDYSFSMKLRRDPRFPFPVSYDDGNHFIASYRGAKPWCPPTWRDISAGFLNARVAFETTGGRVRNATRGGRLEVFERVDFDALMAERQGEATAGGPHGPKPAAARPGRTR